MNSLGYALGFQTVACEQPSVAAQVEGEIPEWLQGSLLRNGPGQWEAGAQKVRHWFDGFALLHSFRIHSGQVTYQNRFLRTPDRDEANRDAQISRPGFATDPCRSLFRKVTSMFVSDLGANANVNVARLGKRFIAMTETPMAIEFDPATLETVGPFNYEKDGFGGQITSAHPMFGEDGIYNFTVSMGRPSRYRGYRIGEGVKRHEFASHPTDQPAYLHSCGLSPREMVLLEGPLVVNPLELLWRSRPYIECYLWKPQLGTRLIRLDRSGAASRVAHGPPMFVFHHVNSFYQGEELCVDVLAYPDASVISCLYFSALETGDPIPMPTLTRLRVRGETFEVEPLASIGLELPRFHPGLTGSSYRFVYGITRQDSAFYNALAKVDVTTGEARTWVEAGCYAGEPVFVSGGPGEDEGVVLSAVLDTRRRQSFLLFLDGASFQEIARAYVPAVVPFGFHGLFTSSKGADTAESFVRPPENQATS